MSFFPPYILAVTFPVLSLTNLQTILTDLLFNVVIWPSSVVCESCCSQLCCRLLVGWLLFGWLFASLVGWLLVGWLVVDRFVKIRVSAVSSDQVSILPPTNSCSLPQARKSFLLVAISSLMSNPKLHVLCPDKTKIDSLSPTNVKLPHFLSGGKNIQFGLENWL